MLFDLLFHFFLKYYVIILHLLEILKRLPQCQALALSIALFHDAQLSIQTYVQQYVHTLV